MEPIEYIDETNPSPETIALYELIFELQKAYMETMKWADRVAQTRFGITGPRILLLSAIAPEARTVSELARTMGSSRQNIQRTTNALVESGLAEYVANPNHRRAKLVRLTAAGDKVMKAWAKGGGQEIQNVAENLPVKKMANAVRTLKEVRELFQNTKL
jgi:DNA-binding MarR family transcriptional regulator